MFDFHFIRPEWLWFFLPNLLLLGYLRLKAYRRKNVVGQGLIAEHLATYLRVDPLKSNNVWPIYTALFLVTLLILALAQPVWRQAATDGQQKAPLLIVMDESQSMLKNDVSPSRGARAHLLVTGLLEKGINRPVAILATAGSTHLLIPPALDADIVKLYLSYLDPSVMPVDGGDFDALAKTVRDTPGLLVDGTILLMVTDGMESDSGVFEKLLAKHNVPRATLAFTSLGVQTGNALAGAVIRGDNLTPNDAKLFDAVNSLAAKSLGSGSEWVDEYRWFVIPLALFLLFWFRKGVVLNWSAAVIVLLLGNPNSAHAGVAEWFFSPDQQGMILLKQGRFKEASTRFEDPGWKGVACYYAEDWQCARQQFAKSPTEAGIFNIATAAAQGGSYKFARDLYAQLLAINADYPQAKKNHDQLVKIVKEIDLLTESQQDEAPPDPETSNNPDDVDPNEKADATEKKIIGPREVKQLSAEDILKSKEMTDRWLRDISKDPQEFIKTKFAYEYATSEKSK